MDTGQREENRRALLRQYSLYTLQYAAFALILAVAFVGELILLGLHSIPEFVIYPLMLVTAIPAILSFYLMIRWWTTQGYVLSMALEATHYDSLPELHQAYQDHVTERTPGLIAKGMRILDGRKVAIIALVAFIVALPVSYYAVTYPADFNLVLLATVSFVAGAIFIVLLPRLISRRAAGRETTTAMGQSSLAWSRRDGILATLAEQAEELRHTANEQSQFQLHDRAQTQTQMALGDLPDRIVIEIDALGGLEERLTQEQRETLTRVVSSLTSSFMTLGLTAEAGRVYAAYRGVVPK